MVVAEGLGPVEDHATAFRSEAIFVRVDGDGGHARTAEVEATSIRPGGGKAGTRQVGQEEGAEAAVNMQGNRVRNGEAGKSGDLVDNAVRVVGSGADEEDRIRIDEAADLGD